MRRLAGWVTVVALAVCGSAHAEDQGETVQMSLERYAALMAVASRHSGATVTWSRGTVNVEIPSEAGRPASITVSAQLRVVGKGPAEVVLLPADVVVTEAQVGGNAAALEKHLGVSGDEILYLGDHIFGDVHVSKSVLRWRTGLILHELEEEIAAVEAFRGEQLQLAGLMHDKQQLEWSHYQLRIAMQRLRQGYGPKPEQSAEQINKQMGKLHSQLTRLDEKIAPFAKRAGESHNARWGLLMRAGADKSQLARQIERHADVYTSRVSNFLFATPFAYLRAQRGSLPHDPTPASVRLAR